MECLGSNKSQSRTNYLQKKKKNWYHVDLRNSLYRIKLFFKYLFIQSVYHTIYPDETAHGRAAILIRSTISHHEIKHTYPTLVSDIPYRTCKLQAPIILVDAQPWSFVLAAVYSLPRHTAATEEYETCFHQLGGNFIAGGDWDAKRTDWDFRLAHRQAEIY